MNNNTATDYKPSLQDIQDQFEHWRSNRSRKRELIPKRLWKAAADLCQIHGIARVSKSLGLSYTDLKKRLPKEPAVASQFMQLDISAFSSQWHMACDRPDGTRLTLSGNGQMPDIKMMIETFLS